MLSSYFPYVKRKPSIRVTVESMPRGIPRSYRETDPTLASNSDLKVPSTKAVRAYIAANGGGGLFNVEPPTSGDVDGVNDEFVFSSAPIAVFFQGSLQDVGVDYTLVGSTVTFAVAPVDGLVKGLVSA